MSKMLSKEIIKDKKNGLSDEEIGTKYGVNLKFIERTVTESLGINISNIINKRSQIKKYSPKNFNIERTSIWSFKSRGNWATHNGNYRGNWSPYIPRNIISRYSREDDLILDYFCGAGPTAVECKLLGRNFIGIDINSQAIELAKANIEFGDNNSLFNSDIKLEVGDARNLAFVDDCSIDLICAHPPYSDIINYTHNNPDDLSNYKVDSFLIEMEKVAEESCRVLKENRHCSILIGDMRKNKNVIPLGFWVIEKYMQAGFQIEELIIKRQHNCRTTGFWYTNSIKYNFLLLAHEYLVVFKKSKNLKKGSIINKKVTYSKESDIRVDKNIELESKDVWIFNDKNWLEKSVSNLIKRYSKGNFLICNGKDNLKKGLDLIIIFGKNEIVKEIDIQKDKLEKNGILAVICEDYRKNNDLLSPTAMKIEKDLRKYAELKIKEIVIVSVENGSLLDYSKNLEINHKYILIYKKH